ncbi:MAG: hypothetical protein M5U14_08055 [Acidimicrobiia bacterium]|nr:hypothetical protein [Acidimicrobiia bacterium]
MPHRYRPATGVTGDGLAVPHWPATWPTPTHSPPWPGTTESRVWRDTSRGPSASRRSIAPVNPGNTFSRVASILS